MNELFLKTGDYDSRVGYQICKVCSVDKPTSAFNYHRQFKTRLDNRCRECVKEQNKLRKSFKERFAHLKTIACDCCGEIPSKGLVVDHCHKSLQFRGWICEPCNHGLGKFGDTLEGVECAVAYLKKFILSS
jgi:hypothetical protein